MDTDTLRHVSAMVSIQEWRDRAVDADATVTRSMATLLGLRAIWSA